MQAPLTRHIPGPHSLQVERGFSPAVLTSDHSAEGDSPDTVAFVETLIEEQGLQEMTIDAILGALHQAQGRSIDGPQDLLMAKNAQ